MRMVTIAHSPDADDAFMFYGIACGAVRDEAIAFRHEEADIEALNTRALGSDLDVTAISFGAWPHFADRYDLLTVGSSFGLGYGPRLVAREKTSPESLRGRTIAVPGERTTAALVLRLLLPGCATRVVPFDRIPHAVASGEADAGVVIHEGQLTHEAAGLHLVADLGDWWSRETGGMPLPLGANAVRRGLDDDVVERVARLLRASIEHAESHRAEAVAHSLKADRGLDLDMGARYVAMYVNRLTLEPGDEGRAAVAELYRRGALAGLVPDVAPRWRP
jgi:1,4-dihydroxy-6-naphthoate synthase